MQALSGSGMSCMSDSWIAFQPAIEEPSNMMPSLNVSSSIVETSVVTCCHLPRGSVKRKSTYFTSLSLIIFKASLAVVIERIPLSCGREVVEASGSDGVQSGFPGSDPNGFFDVGDEDLAVADPPGLGGATDRLDGFLDHVVAEYNLDLHLGEKIDDVFGPAIEFGMPFLASEALGFGNGDALQPDFLQRFLHFVEFEGFDHRLDLLHRVSFPRRAGGAAPAWPRPGLAGSVPNLAEQKKRLSISYLTGTEQRAPVAANAPWIRL